MSSSIFWTSPPFKCQRKDNEFGTTETFCTGSYLLKSIPLYSKWSHRVHLLKGKETLQPGRAAQVSALALTTKEFSAAVQTELSEGAVRREKLRETPRIYALRTSASGGDQFIHTNTDRGTSECCFECTCKLSDFSLKLFFIYLLLTSFSFLITTQPVTMQFKPLAYIQLLLWSKSPHFMLALSDRS